MMSRNRNVGLLGILLLTAMLAATAGAQTIAPSPYMKNAITFPDDAFCARGISRDSVRWLKFTILLDPYDANVVYFQDSRNYVFHYTFANEWLEPFQGLTTDQFNRLTLFAEGQQAVLGTVIFPPSEQATGTRIDEYGIQFVRQDPYPRETIRELFFRVQACIDADDDVQAFYFPTYEQQEATEADSDWFATQGIPLGSTARWADGNVCYAEGWALGRLKFVEANRIDAAYQSGQLEPSDILLTDGIPTELPYVAGIVSLAPSTPNSHVAILARTYGVPFVYLALTDDADRALALAGSRIIFSAYEDEYDALDVQMIDVETTLDEAAIKAILQVKEPTPLSLSPMAHSGLYGLSTEGLHPSDISRVGGKAANFGLLRAAIPQQSPPAIALTFDLWNAFLDLPLGAVPQLDLAPGAHILFWADGDDDQGPTHTSFRLDRAGESVALYESDGQTLIDAVHFGPQSDDVSYGRASDAGDTWQTFSEPTPGQPNADGDAAPGSGVVINEFMAANDTTIEDPDEAGQYPDWIELYNASDRTVTLNGLYLTDDVNEPTKWQIPVATDSATPRVEIERRLADYRSYPPDDMQALSADLGAIRNVFTSADVTPLSAALREAVLAVLTDPNYGFNTTAPLRFRSSTNVEDSADFVGAGLYDSCSGCLADDLAGDDDETCACDPNREGDDGVFEAIRRVFASFYNDNAFLERLRHDVNEAEVGMAVLVHHSFPDEIELANGVATFEVRGDEANSTITFVTQDGAVSVTNPEDASSPEEVTVTILPSGSIVPAKLVTQSSLIPLGGTVMTWRDDYNELVDLLMQVSEAFAAATNQTQYVLDFEYKKLAAGGAVLPEGGLVVKQVRQVPEPNQTPSLTAFLINQPTELEVFPGEFELFGETDVFADHRLKSYWRLETDSMPLDDEHLSETFYRQVEIEALDEDHTLTRSDSMALLPAAEHAHSGTETTDTWQWPEMSNPRTYHLQTTGIPSAVAPAESPLFTLADLGDYAFMLPYRCLTLEVEYQQPVTSWYQEIWPGDPPSELSTTTTNTVHLWSRPAPTDNDVFQERSLTYDGITIETSFYYPPPPDEYPNWDAHTAPLIRWVQTRIEGLTTEPIVLEGNYAQTYRPEHHNLVENFLFEPRLEPGLASDILDQLEALDIRYVHVILDNQGGDLSQIMTHGFAPSP